MKVLMSAIKKLDVALEYGRSAIDFTRETIDSSKAAQELRRVVGEVADRAFFTAVFRIPISLMVKNYSADVLDEEPTQAECGASLHAHFQQRVFELQQLDVDELSLRVQNELLKIVTQISAWGEEIYREIGEHLFDEQPVPEFSSREFWMRVERVLNDCGRDEPFERLGRLRFEVSALAGAAKIETGEDELSQHLRLEVWAEDLYNYYVENRASIKEFLSSREL